MIIDKKKKKKSKDKFGGDEQLDMFLPKLRVLGISLNRLSLAILI